MTDDKQVESAEGGVEIEYLRPDATEAPGYRGDSRSCRVTLGARTGDLTVANAPAAALHLVMRNVGYFLTATIPFVAAYALPRLFGWEDTVLLGARYNGGVRLLVVAGIGVLVALLGRRAFRPVMTALRASSERRKVHDRVVFEVSPAELVFGTTTLTRTQIDSVRVVPSASLQRYSLVAVLADSEERVLMEAVHVTDIDELVRVFENAGFDVKEAASTPPSAAKN